MTAGLCVALIGLLLVLSRIDCGGTYPTLEGPGLTLDEVFNVEQGVYLTAALREYGVDIFTLSGATQVFDDKAGYNPDHPPLGRLCLGLVHELVRGIAPGAVVGRVSIAAGRVASAIAFAATLFVITLFVARRVNLLAGVAAGLTLLMMPRVVGHAHLGSLETFIGFFYTATILAAGRTAEKGHRSDSGRVVLAGFLMGLALLTKIQAIFLPAAIVPWMFLDRKWGSIKSCVLLLLATALTFFALWPWLWLEPVENLSEYLGRTTDRQTVYNYYLGTRYGAPPPDANVPAVPWHYTLVTFLITVPVGLHVLGFTSAVRVVKDRFSDWQGVVLLGTAVPLVAFTLVAPVYDGARLFLVSYPLWAIVIGLGFSSSLEFAKRKRSTFLRNALILGFALQAIGTVSSGPFYLSYYNFAVGGTAGADAIGMERSYWAEAATKSLWEEVPKNSTVYIVPVLDMYRLESLRKYTPVIQRRGIRLEPFKYDLSKQPGLLLILHRRAEAEWIHDYAASKKPISQVTLQGVPLATLVENDGTPFRPRREAPTP